MFKTLHFKSLFLLLCLIIGGSSSAWAAEEVYKTALFGSNYNSKGVSGYTNVSFDATNNSFKVNVENFNNNNNVWAYIKCGGKKGAYTGTITTDAAIDKPVSKVSITIDAITADNVTSIKLYTSSNKSSWTEAGTFEKKTGTKEVSLSSPSENLYYKLEFVCTQASDNGVVTVSKVEYYYKHLEQGEVEAPRILPGDQSVDYGSNIEVTLTQNDAAMILYTTDGSDPTFDPLNGEDYDVDNPFTINITDETVVKAVAFDGQGNASEISSATYSVTTPDDVTVTPAGATGNERTQIAYGQPITLSHPLYPDYGKIIYTTNGSVPTVGATTTKEYTGPIVNFGNADGYFNIKARFVTDNGRYQSTNYKDNKYTILDPNAPVLSSTNNYVNENTVITITKDTEYGVIKYTIDGTEPSATNGLEYSDGVTISDQTTLKACVVIESENKTYTSEVIEHTYKILGQIESIPYEDDLMRTDIGPFMTEGTDGIWVGTSQYGAKASSTNTNNTAWLVSPKFNLNGMKFALLSFEHAAKYLNNLDTQCTLWVREVGGEWEELTINTKPNTNSYWNYVSNETLISGYENKTIQIGFKFIGGGNNGAGWEIKNFKIERGQGEAGLAYTETSFDTHPNAPFATPNLTNPNGLSVSYTSNTPDVADVNESGEVTIKNEEGTATITASFTGDDNYKAGSASYTINVARADAGFSFSVDAVTLTKGDEFTAPTFVNPNSLTGIVFTSSYDAVATVSDAGIITLGGNTGTAVIKATYAQTDEYRAGEATCTITVNPAGVTPEPTPIGYYEKITSTSDLVDGAKYLVVCETQNVAMGPQSSGNSYRTRVNVEISNNKISDAGNATVVTLVASGSSWKLQLAENKYYTTSAAKSMSEENTGTNATIEFVNNNARINFGTPGYLSYNSQSPRFLNYASIQTEIQLYKYVPAESPATIEIAISDAGMATYVSNFDLDFSNSDVKAYIAVEESNRIKFTKVDKVPAATGVLLRATNGGKFAISTTTATDEDKANVAGNKFVRGTGAAVPSQTGDKYNYILNVVNNEIGFYRAANNTVATNRAYIQTVDDARTSTGARISIIFDNEDTTTDIEDVNRILSEETVYDLQGRKIKEAKKGSLYIVNGKKVIIK